MERRLSEPDACPVTAALQSGKPHITHRNIVIVKIVICFGLNWIDLNYFLHKITLQISHDKYITHLQIAETKYCVDTACQGQKELIYSVTVAVMRESGSSLCSIFPSDIVKLDKPWI